MSLGFMLSSYVTVSAYVVLIPGKVSHLREEAMSPSTVPKGRRCDKPLFSMVLYHDGKLVMNMANW